MRAHFLPLIAAIVLTCWAYAPLRSAWFVYDDARSMAIQPMSRTQLLTSVVSTAKLHPRALTVLSFWTTRYFQGDALIHPQVYHLTSVALHLLVGLLLHWAARPMLGGWGASIAAAIFLVHPLNSQAVSYISARSELMAAIGVLIAIGSGLRGSIVGLVFGTALGITGKETAVVALPLCAWLLWRSGTGSVWVWRVLALLFLVTAAGVAWPVLHYGELFHPDMAYGPLGMIVRNAANTARLLALVVWPFGFSIDHDVTVWSLEAIGAGLAGWALLLGFAWHWRQRRPMVLTAVGFVVIALLPRLILPYEEWITEHQLYTAMLGVCWGLGGLRDAA